MVVIVRFVIVLGRSTFIGFAILVIGFMVGRLIGAILVRFVVLLVSGPGSLLFVRVFSHRLRIGGLIGFDRLLRILIIGFPRRRLIIIAFSITVVILVVPTAIPRGMLMFPLIPLMMIVIIPISVVIRDLRVSVRAYIVGLLTIAQVLVRWP